MTNKKFSITLGGNIFEYNTLKQLQKEALKYNIKIGRAVFIKNNVSIRDHVSIGYNVYVEDNVSVGYHVFIGNNASIGDNVSIGGGVSIEDSVSIGHGVSVGYGVSVGNNVSIGYGVSIGDGISILSRAKIQDYWKIDKIIHLMNEYDYHVSGYLIDNEIIIQMGCFTRSLSEWESNFWNNDKEFPKDSPQGKKRLAAFNSIKDIMVRRVQSV